uniref:Pkinase_Tyr domain-containing protein n=1 Tax=Meloidogyne hapla TaxID=6305 RepID=A0A1I8BQA4_MELHA
MACTRKNQNERPTMGKILDFLNGDLKQFEYERRRERRLRPRKWGACLGFCRRN